MAAKRKRGPRKNPEDKSEVVSMSIAKKLKKSIGFEYDEESARMPAIKKSSFMSYLLNLGLEEHKKRKKKK